MYKNSEINRRKDICIECTRFMPIKAKNMCQNCWHKYKRKHDLNFLLRTRYTEIKQRCQNPNNSQAKIYNGKMICTLQEFLDKFLTDTQMLKVFKLWQESNFIPKLAPSIDRIDNKKDYTIDNIQCLPHGLNCEKDQKKLLIDVYDRHGNFLSNHKSLNDAVRQYNVQQSNAWKVLNGQRNHTKGYIFRNAEDES